MLAPRLRSALLICVGSAALAGCGYGPYGYSGVSAGYGSPYYSSGYGSQYYGSGYGSPYYSSYGYGSPYYGAGYGSPYGYGYGYGYQPTYYGWHNDYYYPGTGYYVYGRDGKRWKWSETQRRYWEARRVANPTDNWDGYRRQGTRGDRVVTRPVADTRVVNATRPRSVERETVRQSARADRVERQQTRRSTQSERRAERRAESESRESDRRKRRDRD